MEGPSRTRCISGQDRLDQHRAALVLSWRTYSFVHDGPLDAIARGLRCGITFHSSSSRFFLALLRSLQRRKQQFSNCGRVRMSEELGDFLDVCDELWCFLQKASRFFAWYGGHDLTPQIRITSDKSSVGLEHRVLVRVCAQDDFNRFAVFADVALETRSCCTNRRACNHDRLRLYQAPEFRVEHLPANLVATAAAGCLWIRSWGTCTRRRKLTRFR